MARSILRKMPAWQPVPAVVVATGEAVLAMQMPTAFAFHVPDGAEGHGGSVAGRANDYLVLRGGVFAARGMLEIVTIAAVEAARELPRADEVPSPAPAS